MSLTLLQAWQSAKARLETAGLAGPVIDARLLVRPPPRRRERISSPIPTAP